MVDLWILYTPIFTKFINQMQHCWCDMESDLGKFHCLLHGNKLYIWNILFLENDIAIQSNGCSYYANVYIYIYIHIYIQYIYIYICMCVCIYIYMCVCVCVCVRERERERERELGWHRLRASGAWWRTVSCLYDHHWPDDCSIDFVSTLS